MEQTLWCDGFLPQDYHFGLCGDCVTGQVWICFDQEQYLWDFRLDLVKGTRDLSTVDWTQLLPSEDVTQWMALDYENCRIEMDPISAIPDSLRPPG
ncbi:MAG: hypothetical protein GY747_08825 [Planctomycetes bacterium]|nr:hypothetical protein [Planctomycetota bacterium]MCP4771290.1 hypothetical protein [Planctomycetota bacterium]MCP4860477.1 hypothetical protein [Planctomycetota bacterium]